MQHVEFECPICGHHICLDDGKEVGDLRGLQFKECPFRTYSGCVTRERAVGAVLSSLFTRDRLKQIPIFECSPAMRGLSSWLKQESSNYRATGYFPDKSLGSMVNGLLNENLEHLTLPDESVDVWLHLDVMEHLFNPFEAMKEIYRTLKRGGICLFTVPTYPNRVKSEQVAWLETNGSIKTVGEPEYHGNPQNPEMGALVTWRYGYDLPLLIQRETGFDVEVRRWQSKAIAVMGPMTEVYICTKADQIGADND